MNAEGGGVMDYLDTQPAKGISYMLGNESWLPHEKRSQRRLHVEEWGNLGPMELRPDVKPNAIGLRVRVTDIPAPTPTATAKQDDDGLWYWEEASDDDE